LLTDLTRQLGDYAKDVFVTSVDGWLLLGLAAQLMFSLRFILQWIASERAGQSVVPLTFWLFSIAGGLLLLLYALYRRDAVFILGQAFGIFIYSRNLYFVARERKRNSLTLKA
jgi:lipid-A-disaccharide synthase-like uncharacterized protein